MNKMAVGIVVGLVALVAIFGVVLANRPDSTKVPSPNQTNPSSQNETTNTNNQNEPEQPSNSPSSGPSIEIRNFAFSPQTITVKKGTTVRWTNQDTMRHDVTPDEESDAFKASELLDKGETYEWTFDTPGTYTYHCSPHPNMTGTVVVTD